MNIYGKYSMVKVFRVCYLSNIYSWVKLLMIHFTFVLGHSPPPNFHKDERTQRQYIKLKKKLEHKQSAQLNEQRTPPVSPRKGKIS